MEEERVGPQDGGKTTTTTAATSSVEDEPGEVGPPFGGEFDPIPAAAVFDDDDVILALPSFHHGAPEEALADDEVAEGYDDIDDGGSDSESEEEEEEGNDNEAPENGGAAAGIGRLTTFLGQPARFASYQGTAGFMRISAAAAPLAGAGAGGGVGVITVHFRYYRFSRRPRGGGGPGGVEAPEYRTDLHHVLFLLPPAALAADPAGALRLAGASLAADARPRRARARLQVLWSALLAAAPVRVPPPAPAAQARRLVVAVTVDAGALVRRADRTPELAECVRAALAAEAREVDAAPLISGQEQRLPAPVVRGGGGVPRAAKRRRVGVGGGVAAAAAGEEEDGGEACAICWEVMVEEQGGGLAAWPRCGHVFHGRCLEQLLATVRHRCPLCRSTLSVREVCLLD
ncbi:unnamed protein product [Urochloa humidicola]